MANIIDILINAKWTGGAATKAATGDMRAMGNTATSTSIELAAVGQKSALLNNKMAELGQEVALGAKTVGEASAEYDAFAGSLATVGGQAPKTGVNIGGLTSKLFLMTAAIGAATVTAKKFYDLIRSGAELENMQIRFDRLATTIGTTGELLQGDLRIAIGGLASEAQAIALATDLMALGLAKSHDEAVRLASVSAQLGFDMNQLVLTLTNQTTMRFDALGVAVDGFEDKVKKLEESGLAANEAFKLAFLEQAEEQIEKVGSRADTTAGQLDILEATWQNNMDALKRATLTTLGPLIDGLTKATAAAQELNAAIEKLNAGADLREQGDAVAALKKQILELEADQSRQDFAYRFVELYNAIVDVAAALVAEADTVEEQNRIWESFGFVVDGATLTLEGFSVKLKDVNSNLEEIELDKFYDGLERVDNKMAQLSARTFDSADGTKELSEEMQELAEKVEEIEFQELLDAVGLSNDEFIKLAFSMGGAGPAAEYLEGVLKSVTTVSNEMAASLARSDDKLAQFGITADQLASPELLKKRADLWEDFQEDLTDITEQASEQRTSVESRYEEQRTEIVERYGQRRAQEEEDWQRSRARAEEDFRRSIDETRAESTERQIELRENTNIRLQDLERDHLDRMAEIIENADLQLAEAASRLDAQAVAAIERQRDDALQDERDSYKKQYQDIQKQLSIRLKAEQEAAEERIEELTEFHERRKQQEDEDRRIRLERLQAAHDEQLRELEQQKTDRLNQITQQAAEERAAREQQYIDERTRLADHMADRAQLEEQWMNYLLQKEEQFWKNRLGLVGGGDAGTVGGGAPDPVGGGGDDGTTQDQPSRAWLENTALRVANPGTSEQAFTWIRWIKTQTDAQLARWIEQNSDIDVPGYRRGTLSAIGGLSLVGEDGPELVNLPQGAQVFPNDITANLFARAAGGVNVGDVTIIIEGTESPDDTAQAVRREMTALFEELAR